MFGALFTLGNFFLNGVFIFLTLNENIFKWFLTANICRSSRPKVFCKKSVLRNFAKFTRKHLCQSVLFNKGLGLATLIKKRLWHRCFLVNFTKFLKKPFLTEHLWWLLLYLELIFFLRSFLNMTSSKYL